MSEQKLPRGFTHEKMRQVIDHYENQTGAEAVAEMEVAFATGRGYRTMHVPIEVEAQVLQLIAAAEKARKAVARRTNTLIAEEQKPYGQQHFSKSCGRFALPISSASKYAKRDGPMVNGGLSELSKD